MFASRPSATTLASTLSLLVLCAWPAAPVLAQSASTSPAKKELIERVLELQRPALEAMGRALAEQPAQRIMQQAGPILQQRIAADKREVVGREIEADVRKYVDEAVPLVRDQAIKLAPSTLGVVIDERMDESELRQLIAALEAPAFRKFQQVSGEGQRVLLPKLVAEARVVLEPKARAMDNAVAKRLGITPPAAAASSPKK
jgi:hypothetical protein